MEEKRKGRKTKTRGIMRTFLFIVYCIIALISISNTIHPSRCLLNC